MGGDVCEEGIGGIARFGGVTGALDRKTGYFGPIPLADHSRLVVAGAGDGIYLFGRLGRHSLTTETGQAEPYDLPATLSAMVVILALFARFTM